ncbi:glutamine amidotransferase [Arsenicicoccus piscis]|uniref:Glutamine amidotransferase n=1 Tax=Arsenicicoccus piscis TaxID=673954 RepID=A0ABQ6HTF8_9MICO|nr:glutamine amidotransferase [Arsenicicoccus piscis]GMA21805.1 glutamine amidotransferase [Arsenicicoccus piscis]
MRPFLLLATRPEDLAADDEYAAFLRYGGLHPDELVRVRLERDPMPEIDLDDWSGIILGGGPFNNSDAVKSPVQQRVERELSQLLDEVVARDHPFLGACYGIGTLGTHQGGLVDRTYGETIAAVPVHLTDAGREDPIFGTLPDTFVAFAGHKEAITVLPPTALTLATSAACPVQAFRVGRNVYATQFHPELDAVGLALRVDVYGGHGYFAPEDADAVKAMAFGAGVTEAERICRAFVTTFAR